MTYVVKECFYTLQGEGYNAGKAAVFVRFAGCNLWTGREQHRPSAICQFCDTDFVGTDGEGGGFYTAEELATKVRDTWLGEGGSPFVVLTGGEPLLQVDAKLTERLIREGFRIAVETNGTQPIPKGISWVCVSPKAGAPVVIPQADELKLIYPQSGAMPEDFASFRASHFFLQPKANVVDRSEWGFVEEITVGEAIEYCLQHPRWRLSLQTHKYLGIP